MKRLPLVPLVALATLALDQFTKWLVVTSLALGESIYPLPALSRLFSLTYVTNTGAAFGLLKEAGMVFVFVAIVVITIIVLYMRRVPADQQLVRVALGLQLGGALGNLIDRLRLGHVVDFIDLKFWPVFNVADSAIVIGVALLAIAFWRQERAAARSPEPSSGSGQFPG
ncbi:MAG TPA: signal peptidase II [Anaerolineae bacterium]|nr:signal peptidase II [Anaerolineae bacterium]